MTHIQSDRLIKKYVRSLHSEAAIDYKYDFDPRVQQECMSQRVSNVGLKICKMIIIGDMGVGKTSLVNRFCRKSFDRDYKATIGVDFEVERFGILNNPFTLQMWDTAGQERFLCIAAAYYRGANIVVIVFDVTAIQTLDNAEEWLKKANAENAHNGNLLLFLIGTKKDLLPPSTYAEVENEAIKKAKRMNAEFWGVSSKTGENVKEFFSRAAILSFEQIVLKDLENKHSSPSTLIGNGDALNLSKQDQIQQNRTKKSCCNV